MTRWTTQIKQRRFSMPVIRRRCKKMMRKRFKKTIKLSILDKVWADWVELAVIRPLIKYGKVVVDHNFTIEIVGKHYFKDKGASAKYIKGIAVTSNGFKVTAQRLAINRKDYLYKIVVTDNNYKKGQLIFKADEKLKKRVREALENTQTFYRIVA